jgi:hypothetical protein
LNLRIGHRAESLVVLLRHDADAAVPRGAAEGNAQPRHGPSSVPCLFLLYCPIAYSLRLRKHCRKVLWAFPCSTTGSNCTALRCTALRCAALHCVALHCVGSVSAAPRAVDRWRCAAEVNGGRLPSGGVERNPHRKAQRRCCERIMACAEPKLSPVRAGMVSITAGTLGY